MPQSSHVTRFRLRAPPTVSSISSARRLLLPLLFGFALSGCSVAKLGYNHADWLLLRKMDAYMDLSAEQSNAALDRFDRRMQQHRRVELPGYLDYLRRTRSLAEDGLARDEAEWIVRRGRDLALDSVERTVPAIAASLSELSPAQIQHLEKHFAKVNGKFRRKYLPRSERERFLRSVRRTTLRIEHWTGPLSEDQRQLVTELRAEFPQSTEKWLEYNMGRQRRLLALLRQGAETDVLEAHLTRWWVRLEERDHTLKQNTDDAFEALMRLILEVDASLDVAQRRFLLWRMDNYIEQMEELIAEQ